MDCLKVYYKGVIIVRTENFEKSLNQEQLLCYTAIKYDIKQTVLKEVIKKIVALRDNQFEGKNNKTFECVFSVLYSMVKG